MSKEPDIFSATLKAREIIRILSITVASDLELETIAMARNAIVKEGPLKGADGRLSVLSSEGLGLITVRCDIRESRKKRFVIAHELGHFELHRVATPSFSCTDTDFSEWLKAKPLEVEANYFAAELIMPEDLFKDKIKSAELSIELLQTLTEEFQTSLTATGIRFVNFRPEYALVFSENNKIKWFQIKEGFPYYLHVSGDLHHNSYAYDFFKGKDLPKGFAEVPPEAWVDDYKFKGSKRIMELSIGIKAYNQVLSFIYIEDVEEGYDDEDEYYKELDGSLKFR